MRTTPFRSLGIKRRTLVPIQRRFEQDVTRFAAAEYAVHKGGAVGI